MRFGSDQRVNIDTRVVERWRPNDSAAETVAETLEWQPDRFIAPLAIDLPRYFSRVLGESIA